MLPDSERSRATSVDRHLWRAAIPSLKPGRAFVQRPDFVGTVAFAPGESDADRDNDDKGQDHHDETDDSPSDVREAWQNEVHATQFTVSPAGPAVRPSTRCRGVQSRFVQAPYGRFGPHPPIPRPSVADC